MSALKPPKQREPEGALPVEFFSKQTDSILAEYAGICHAGASRPNCGKVGREGTNLN